MSKPSAHAALDAPRGLLAGFGPAFAWSLRLAAGRRRRLVFIVLLSVGLGLLVAWVAGRARRGEAPGRGDVAFRLWSLLDNGVLPYVMPLVALTLIAGAFQREISERTLVFHLVRPIARHTLFLARFAASFAFALPIALITPLVAVHASGLPLPTEVYVSLLVSVSLGLLTIGAITYVLAFWFRFGIVASLAWVFLIESFLQSTSGSMQRLATSHYVLSVFHRGSDAAFAELSSRVRGALKPATASLNPSSLVQSSLQAERIGWAEPASAALVLAVIALTALALGVWQVRRRDFPLKD